MPGSDGEAVRNGCPEVALATMRGIEILDPTLTDPKEINARAQAQLARYKASTPN
jgi:hypothetical protein